MKILAFAASNSSQSINRALVTHAAERLVALLPGADVSFLSIDDYEMPIFSVDREKASGIPALATDFREAIGAADALMISYAEHNGGYTAAFKNLFDWASRIDTKVFQQKPTLALSTSPGGRGGASVLRSAVESAPHFGAELVASLSVPRFYDNFDGEAGALRPGELADKLGKALGALAERLRGETP